jgi:hypothetical protein
MVRVRPVESARGALDSVRPVTLDCAGDLRFHIAQSNNEGTGHLKAIDKAVPRISLPLMRDRRLRWHRS